MKKAKLIHLTEKCIESLSIAAVMKKPKTDFKNFAQEILENESKKYKNGKRI